MKPTTRILSYLAIMAVVVTLFGLNGPENASYRSSATWLVLLQRMDGDAKSSAPTPR